MNLVILSKQKSIRYHKPRQYPCRSIYSQIYTIKCKYKYIYHYMF